ncbi:hypothetical protein GW17_00062273 [Ensete ventricosum]|nr:hypothetical protein GW17_00062273 [Ensete ventricosum]
MPLIPRRRRRRRRHVATKVMTRGVTRLRVAHPMVRGAEVRCGCRVTAMTSGRRSIPEVRKGRRRRLGCRLDRAEESSGSALYRSRLEYMGCVARAVSRVGMTRCNKEPKVNLRRLHLLLLVGLSHDHDLHCLLCLPHRFHDMHGEEHVDDHWGAHRESPEEGQEAGGDRRRGRAR